ncbi:HAD-IIA family hydrolase [Mycobacterium sp. CBMA293]|uniref:HAD-IIA family hydrolase n=1 Tax=unclassified Mycolicibacterium TaxID=2636767 RepID=UPI0012DC6E6F|nr:MULTISPECIES: HAD-IIA family hydrolase [unclassified Mycolicibacterium]MUL48817.1 HAD-IIA family hydrolase [Mycolicibacterium sp. CBMA 360]MUL62273.1 HAD-IIA family hydrolase [Mycolicibacterium sp. CBMA 335]MUL71733.1 HAD-IIA family hydrolase [Mycolicibacterium sp. CBMA 311]MUL93688.1 HAD-IIA family hydrolase [Mycolicibacterium sp. CBMA 230]MUM09374.1 HAD family hydrolase [Mycolicibacterium sp. CBMA 213]
MSSLAQLHDCLLLDLDGTVFRGHEATDGAVTTLAAVASRKLYVTNNASRSPAEVADHLDALGFAAHADDVVTSAQSAARLLAEQLTAGSKVLVIGTDSLAAEVSNVGLEPVREFSDDPVAVVQGHSPQTGWADLAEAALTIRAGGVWVAANVDKTLPSERGLLPGNGSMVAALRTATECVPQVAGKPEPTLMNDALARGQFTNPLVVGDRLDTDIAGARAAGLPCLMVLTGVNTAADMVHAILAERPDYLGADLRSLTEDAETLRVGPSPAWRVQTEGGDVTVHATGEPVGDPLSVVRATAAAVWAAELDGRAHIAAGDDTARAALDRWSLLGAADPLA